MTYLIYHKSYGASIQMPEIHLIILVGPKRGMVTHPGPQVGTGFDENTKFTTA